MADEKLIQSINQLTDVMNKVIRGQSSFGPKDTFDKPGTAGEEKQNKVDKLNKELEVMHAHSKIGNKYAKADIALKKKQIQLAKAEIKLQEALNDGDAKRIAIAEHELEVAKEKAERQEKANNAVKNFTKELGDFVGWNTSYKEAINQSIQDVRKTIELTGGGMSDYWDSLQSGISYESMLELQQEYKQASISMRQGNSAVGNFSAAVAESQFQMFNLTGSMEDAAKVTGANIAASRSLGLSQSGAAEMMTMMGEQFGDFHNSLGYTAQEFTSLQESITKDADTRNLLLRMNEQQRKAYVKSRLELVKHAQALGMSAEQAQMMGERFSEQFEKKDAKDRYRDSVKMALMGGMTGAVSGAEQQRMIELSQKGSRMTEEEKKELQSITGRIGDAMATMEGAGFGQEIIANTLNKDGLVDVAKSQSTELGGTNVVDLNAKTEESNKILTNILGMMDFTKNGFSSSLGMWGTAIISTLVGKSMLKGGFSQNGLTRGMKDMGSKMFSGADKGKELGGQFKNLAKGAGGMMMTGAKSIGGAAVGGVKAIAATAGAKLAVAFAAGYGIGTLIDNYLEESQPEIREALGKFVFDMVEGVKGMYESIKTGASEALDSIPGMLKTWQQNFSQMIDNMIMNLIEGVKNIPGMGFIMGDPSSDSINTIADSIGDGIKSIASWSWSDNADDAVKTQAAGGDGYEIPVYDERTGKIHHSESDLLAELKRQNKLLEEQNELAKATAESNQQIASKTEKPSKFKGTTSLANR